jgi:DNA-directed RNA polymerase specialized sigma24 family protein
VSAPAAAPERFGDFDVERDYARLRGPLLGLLRRDGWKIADDEWDATWNAVCANVWRRQQVSPIDFRGEPLNYLLAAAKNELRRERRRPRAELVSLDADDAPEPSSPAPEPDDELDLRDKLRLAQTIARHRLRPRELRVWGLRIVCGLTYEEGAARMGIPPKRFEKELLSAHAKIADEIRAVASGTWCESTKGVSLLRAYEQGVLDPDGDALRELRDHARTCPACRRAMKAVEGIVPLMLPPAPVLLAATAPADGASIERKAHALTGLRRAAGELWHAIAGSPASAGAVHAGGEGGAAATASGIGLLGVAGGKAIAVCLTAATVGTCLTVAAGDPPASKHHRRQSHAARHGQAHTAVPPAPRTAPARAMSSRPQSAAVRNRAPSLAHAAAASSRQRRVFRAARRSSGASAAGGEFGGESFESQSSGGGSTASTAAVGSDSGGGGSGAGSSSKPSGGEFSSGGFEK